MRKIYFKSKCICRNEKFIKYLSYDTDMFPLYKGTIIGKCINCGVLKTVKRVKSFDSQRSNIELYEQNNGDQQGLITLVEVIRKYKLNGRVLDIGSASGVLLSLLNDEGFVAYGIEPNLEAYNFSSKKNKNTVHHGTISTFKHKDKFDVIILNHVLEHIEDVEYTLHKIESLLKVNGLLVIGVPNISNIVFLLRKTKWESLLPDQHIWHFSYKQLKNYLEKRKYKLIDVSYFNHTRSDYPHTKKVYFGLLGYLNYLIRSGEAMQLVFKKVR